MGNTQEALKLALEALESVTGHFTRTPSTLRDSEVRGEAHKAITTIREALAEQPAQQQEPVLCINPKVIDPATGKVRNGAGALTYSDEPCAGWSMPLYEHPPAQQQDYWQEEARRYSQNADFWRSKYESATAQQQSAERVEPVALPEKVYEFVPTPEPVKWHHPECEGACIACLIEQVVQEAYGSQGLGYLQRHLTSPPAQRKPLTDKEIESINVKFAGSRDLARLFARAIEAAHGITGEQHG